MFCEPLGEWRQATARKHRTKFDWAHEVASLLDRRYADCDQITLVCDNLNTHTPSEHFTRPLNQNEHVNTFVASTSVSRPSTEVGSGSWLNIAENELSSMTRQCLNGRRIGELSILQSEIEAWSNDCLLYTSPSPRDRG